MAHLLFHPQNTDIRYLVILLCLFVVLSRYVFLRAMLLWTVSFVIYFFRDPEVRVKYKTGSLTCPCYGKVTNIHQGTVSIFLSVFDPHAQYAPCDVVVESIEYIPGAFHPAQLYTKTRENERCITTFRAQGSKNTFQVTQIAGFIARRILRFHKVGDRICQGAPFGMIRFGSRVDIQVPIEYEILVREGDYVSGQNTTLARLRI